jgi:hypothetical protein
MRRRLLPALLPALVLPACGGGGGRNTNSIRGNPSQCPAARTGSDEFFAFITLNQKGEPNVVFHDRRLDTESPIGVGAWPASKTEQDYLV